MNAEAQSLEVAELLGQKSITQSTFHPITTISEIILPQVDQSSQFICAISAICGIKQVFITF